MVRTFRNFSSSWWSCPHPALVREKTRGAKLKQLSAAEDGAVWGVNNNGEVLFALSVQLICSG